MNPGGPGTNQEALKPLNAPCVTSLGIQYRVR